jgi:hypothetical protein
VTRSFDALYAEAHERGLRAANTVVPRTMVVQRHANPLDDDSHVVKEWIVPEGMCGFAWVNVKPGNSPFARWLKANGYARSDSYEGGVTIWVSDFGQSHTRKRAYAQAFVAVLTEEGIRAHAGDRLD